MSDTTRYIVRDNKNMLKSNFSRVLGSISAVFSSPVLSAGSIPEQRLVLEPTRVYDKEISKSLVRIELQSSDCQSDAVPLRYGKLVGELGHLGPLHMGPVHRAGSVSEISPDYTFLCKNSMCSYEKAG